ncbi:ribonuclease N1 [Candidatus Fermentibacteria bacterium]|nr:ribonuclease N1 [Candidatus Fermentibacteria bacterium]
MRTSVLKRMGASLAILAVACLLLPLAGCGGLLPSFEWLPPASDDNAPADSGVTVVKPDAVVIGVDELPPEARATLELIESGGPFPYSRDGAVFHNYEGLLPVQDDGYYLEYTVLTPGASDRGARRIVAGASGERYYTDDHYSSFKRIVE